MKRLLLPFLALFVVFGFKAASIRTIAGTIVDKTDGKSIPSASIRAMPSNTKMAPDNSGRFKLVINKNDKTLEVSSLGYQTQTITLTRRKNLEIKLEPNPIDPKHTIIVGEK